MRPKGGRWHVRAIPSLINGRIGGLALDAAGNATVAWDEDGGRVLAARRPVGGRWGSPVAVTDADTGSNAGGSRVAMGGEGTTTVAWTLSGSASTRLLQGAQRSTSGTWGGVQPLSEGAPADPGHDIHVAMDAQGHTVVVWTEVDGTTTRVMVTAG